MQDLTIQYTSNFLIKGIEKNISIYGFRFNKAEKYFIRKCNNDKQIFDILFYKMKEGIYVEPVVSIKIKQIEDIYHKICLKDPKFFNATRTLTNNLFQIISYFENGIEIGHNERKRYLIEEENDINILINVISKNFKSYVLPYFEQNNNIAKVDQLLNKYPKEISIHNSLYPIRACLAIIAAKLNNNPNFNNLKQIYTYEMKDAVESYKIEFQKLLELEF
jgi:hypothetical protein